MSLEFFSQWNPNTGFYYINMNICEQTDWVVLNIIENIEYWVCLWITIDRKHIFNILCIQTMTFCLQSIYFGYNMFCFPRTAHFVSKLNTSHFILYVHVFLFCILRPPQSSVYSLHSLSFFSRTSPGNSRTLSFHQPPNASPSSR